MKQRGESSQAERDRWGAIRATVFGALGAVWLVTFGALPCRAAVTGSWSTSLAFFECSYHGQLALTEIDFLIRGSGVLTASGCPVGYPAEYSGLINGSVSGSNVSFILHADAPASGQLGFSGSRPDELQMSGTFTRDGLVAGIWSASRIPVCGDGVTQGLEQCDDGNTSNADACLASCAVNQCGDGHRNPQSEECDDANTQAGDGCTAACQLECSLTGEWSLPLSPTPLLPLLRDGLRVHLREDPGGIITGIGHVVGDAADVVYTLSGVRADGLISLDVSGPQVLSMQATLSNCSTLSTFLGSFTRLRDLSYCGDNQVDAEWGEACDDGNWVNGDSCTALCTQPTCGNRIVESAGGEECDDGNVENCDACTTGCTKHLCGDARLVAGCEQCDDGNAVDDGNGCSDQCTVYFCGNGNLERGEDCDDGNADAGDGCDPTCRAEGCDFTGEWRGTARITKHQQCWTECKPVLNTCVLIVTCTPQREESELGAFSLHAEEAPTGAISGSATWAGQAAQASLLSGQRTGGRLSLAAHGEAIDGLIYPCDAVRLRYNAGDPLSPDDYVEIRLLRQRPAYCGDGVLDPLSEMCDDGNFNSSNTAASDQCSAVCTLGSGCGDGVVAEGEDCDDGNLYRHDECLDCRSATCGDGILTLKTTGTAETCDDANANATDGCDECQLGVEDTGVAPLGGLGVVVTTDTENDGATPSDPVETRIVDSCGDASGTVQILEQAAPPSAPVGWTFMGTTVTITRSGNAVDRNCPLRIVFVIDPSVIPDGQLLSDIAIYKNGVKIPDCPAPGVPEPLDACVESRSQTSGGDVRVVIRTIGASDWTFGDSICGSAPLAGCLVASPRGAKFKVVGGARPRVVWSWKREGQVTPALFGDPTASSDVTLCAYDASGRVFTASAPAGGVCGAEPCWSRTGSGNGVLYKNAALQPDGVGKLSLKASATGRGKIKMTGRGPDLALPPLPLRGPVRMQLRSQGGACFEARFSSSITNDEALFKAVSD